MARARTACDSPDTIEVSIKNLEAAGLLRPEETTVLQALPMRPNVVVAWLATFWEGALSPKSEMACAPAHRTCSTRWLVARARVAC